ncbi:MAG: M28 family peptidase [candidate division WOR-3 bacterium]|nr:M28 family peptidase [candidate division WOR-3 bacterium]
MKINVFFVLVVLAASAPVWSGQSAMPLDSVWDRFPPPLDSRLSTLDSRPLPDTFIQRLIAKGSPDSIQARLQRLQDFITRYSYTDSCRRAEEYVASYFTSLGLDSVQLDSYPAYGDTWRNVVGTILGKTHPEKILIVCGHMDATSEIADSVAPGCEDNGSGTCAAIEAARVLVGESLDCTVKFIAFTGEDVALNGSDHYAREARARGDDIICAFNFDMIAWPGGDWGVALVGVDAAKRVVQYEAQVASTYTTLAHRETYRSFPSDSRSFDNQGYAATSGYEYGADPYVWYHTSHDSLYRLSMPLAAEVTKMAVATLASLAVAPGAPKGFRLNDAGNGTSLEASWQASTEPDLAGYKLLWGTAPGVYTDSVTLGLLTSRRIDGLQTDTCYYSVVVARDSNGFEGPPSVEVSATPRLLPLAPDSLLAMPFWFGMGLSWLPNRELDLAGYNLYRGTDSAGLVRINPSIITDTAYRDSGLLSDTMYFYAATAVDTQDNESPHSPVARGKPIALDHGILLVDETRNGTGQPGNPSDAQVDDFYHAMLAGFVYSDWDATELGVPLAGDIGPYSTIVWHGDDYSQQQIHPAITGLGNYLEYGGRLWLVGWKPVLAVADSGQYPFTFVPGEFAYDYLHITAGFERAGYDFKGATGFSGYPDVSVDSAKLFTSAQGRLPFVDAFAVRSADTVLRFNSFSGDSFAGKPVGVRWLGAPGKVVFFGFPFYYMKEAEARPVAVKVLTDLGEPYGIEESAKSQVKMTKALPTVVRNVLSLPLSPFTTHYSLFDRSGRAVLSLRPGLNDVHRVPAGVYFVCEAQAQAQAAHKVIVTR